MLNEDELHKIYSQFRICSPIFIALGDEIRQKLILDIVDSHEKGINVTNLSAKSKLSRPAISHHLKVLKDSGLIKPIKQNLEEVAKLIASVQNVIHHMDESAVPAN